MNLLPGDSAETRRLLERACAGEAEATERLLSRHRPYLRRLIELRLDPRLRPRVDPSDVVQEAQIEALRRLEGYLARPPMPFRLWLRQIAYDRLVMLYRHHVEASRRSVGRDVPLPDHSSLVLAQQLLAPGPSPAQQAVQQEFARRVRQAVDQLPQAEREILIMRKLEGLSNQEAAQVLNVDPATASRRLGRAVIRLRDLLRQTGLMESEA
jgi:RNA polymerase sigma-70 factor (ECF subfamily)